MIIQYNQRSSGSKRYCFLDQYCFCWGFSLGSCDWYLNEQSYGYVSWSCPRGIHVACKTPAQRPCRFASGMAFSGVACQTQVDYVVKELASNQQIDFWGCSHAALLIGEKPDQCVWFLASPAISYLVGWLTDMLHLRRVRCAADVRQTASTWDLQPTHASRRNDCGTPQFMEGRNLSMQCLGAIWHLLKIRGQKQPGSLGWVGMHHNILQVQ